MNDPMQALRALEKKLYALHYACLLYTSRCV